MSSNQTPSALPPATKEYHPSKTSSLATLNQDSEQKSVTQSQRPSGIEYSTSNSENMHFSEVGMPRTQPWTSPMALSSGQSPSRSATSSTRGGSSMDSSRLSEATHDQRSSIERAMDKAKSKLGSRSSRVESLPDDDADFERQKAKEMEKYRRKAEYERLELREKTIFGMKGAGGWTSG